MVASHSSCYVAELYVSRTGRAAVADAVRRLDAATAELNGEGTRVRHLRTIFVPDDETCYHLFEASSAEAVDAAGERATIRFGRVVPAVEIDAQGSAS